MFSFSTCWNSDSLSNGEIMMDQIRSLGFQSVELSHGIRMSLIEGIDRALKGDPKLRISSLHNFCPLPVGFMRAAPNIYLLSSERETERLKAIRHTLGTLDFAVRMCARFVVLHLGSVPMGNYTKDLLKLVYQGKRETPHYEKTLEKAIAKRKEKGSNAFRRSMKSLETLVKAAEERKLVLGIESRYRLEEIPSEAEFTEIFRAFGPNQVGYWHDSGHTQTWHNLGLCDHVQWLRQFQGRLIGCHLHDVAYPDMDHQIPGDGNIPFDRLTALKRSDVLKVFEFEPDMDSELLKERLPPFMANFETHSAP